MKMDSKKIAICGVFTALAFIFAYVEMLVPIPLGIPGIKLGLANCCIILILYKFGIAEALIINLARIVLSSILFGNATSFMFSLCAGMISTIIMILLKKINKFSITAVSITGGVTHNIIQIIVAIFILDSSAIIYYLPVLIITGCVTGALIGLLGGYITFRLNRLN